MKIEKVYRKDLNAYRWKIDITIMKRRVRRADFLTKREAVEAIAAMHSEARAYRYGLVTPKPKITLQNLYDRITQDHKGKDNPRMLQILKEFISTVDPPGLLTDLARADWKNYADAFKKRNLQAATINRYLAEVSRILSCAPEFFPELEDWRPPSIPWEPKPLGRDRVLSQAEIEKILAALRVEHWKSERPDRGPVWRREIYDLFRLMLLTGAREGELLHLRQSAISWDWKTVQIESKKGGGSRRVIPLSDSSLEILRSRQVNAPRVFKPMPRTAIHDVLCRSDALSGVAYGNNVDGGWVLYDARHAAATVMESAGIPYSAVSAILGHKRKDQTATYTHADLTVMRRGINYLESWCREIDGFFHTIAQNATPIRMPVQSARG